MPAGLEKQIVESLTTLIQNIGWLGILVIMAIENSISRSRPKSRCPWRKAVCSGSWRNSRSGDFVWGIYWRVRLLNRFRDQLWDRRIRRTSIRGAFREVFLDQHS